MLSSTDESAVAGYKRYFRECLDRRPSGMRQKLALALGKHKSFVSQITSPSYSVPIPAGDLPVIFEVCHLSAEEQARFLELYEQAHPGRAGRRRRTVNRPHEVRVAVPAFRTEATAREVEAAIQESAARIIRLARAAEQAAEAQPAGDGDEEVP